MRVTTCMAALLLLGACNLDHSLGWLGPDSGVGQMKSDAVASSLLTEADAPIYADAASIPMSVDGGATQAAPTNGVDARTIGPLGPTQSWTGYVENFTFPSGSDVIKFTFAYDSSGQVVGQVTLGTGTPPPPATDPNVGYPPGFTGPMIPNVIEGFPYSMVSGTFAANRLRFTIEDTEVWDGWCALQTPSGDPLDNCLSTTGGHTVGGSPCSYTTSSGSVVIIDCGKLALCTGAIGVGVCLCTPTGCGLRPGFPSTSFDMFLANGSASGSAVGDAVSGNIHFLQDP